MQGTSGPEGPQGTKGDKGEEGDDGNGGFLSGITDPTSDDGVNGDFFINTSS